MLNFLQTFSSRHEIYKTGKTSKTGKTLLKKPYFTRALGSYQGLTFCRKSYLFLFKRQRYLPIHDHKTILVSAVIVLRKLKFDIAGLDSIHLCLVHHFPLGVSDQIPLVRPFSADRSIIKPILVQIRQ